jgi:hypothetical protein
MKIMRKKCKFLFLAGIVAGAGVALNSKKGVGYHGKKPAAPASAVLVNSQGMALAEMKSMEPSGDGIAVQAVLLGSMPETVNLKPGQLWNVIGLLNVPTIIQGVKMLIKGFKNRDDVEAAGAAGPELGLYEGPNYGMYTF